MNPIPWTLQAIRTVGRMTALTDQGIKRTRLEPAAGSGSAACRDGAQPGMG